MRQDVTELVVVLDRSGSMIAIRDAMQAGFDRLIAEQRLAPGVCRVTLVQFDDEAIETVYAATPVADVPPLVLIPRGWTPLLDAVGRTITQTGERLAALPEADRPGRVAVLIITDGQENASREYTKAQVKAMVEHQASAYRWAFSYLGANVDAFAEAGSMGIATSAAASYTPTTAGAQYMFAAASDALVSYRAGLTPDLTYDPVQRQQMNPNAPLPNSTTTPLPTGTTATDPTIWTATKDATITFPVEDKDDGAA